MTKQSTLTAQEIAQIYQLDDVGKSARVIAGELEITYPKVRRAIEQRKAAENQQKIAALISSPVAQTTTKSVFDIIARLEECLAQIEELMDEPGELKERVMVRAEKRMLIAEARATLESIYNVKLLNDFIETVASILESETPGSRKRIFERLEQSIRGFAAISLVASSRGPAGIAG